MVVALKRLPSKDKCTPTRTIWVCRKQADTTHTRIVCHVQTEFLTPFPYAVKNAQNTYAAVRNTLAPQGPIFAAKTVSFHSPDGIIRPPPARFALGSHLHFRSLIGSIQRLLWHFWALADP